MTEKAFFRETDAGRVLVWQARYPPFEVLLERFHSSLDSLRLLVGAVTPYLEQLDVNSAGKPELKAAFEALAPQTADALNNLLRERLDRISGTGEDRSNAKKEGAKAKPGPYKEKTGQKKQYQVRFDISLTAQDLIEAFGPDAEAVARYLRLRERPPVSHHRKDLFLGSILPVATGSVEVLVSGVMSQHYRLHPSAIDSQAKEFSLADLREYASPADAEEAAVSRRIESTIRLGLREWSSWFVKLGIPSFDLFMPDITALDEIFQRRHIMVHSAGLVSPQYLKKVPNSKYKLGKPASVSREYLLEAIDTLEIFGTVVTTRAWTKWLPGESEAVALALIGRGYESMLGGRWKIVEMISEIDKSLPCRDDSRLRLQCNRWLAAKRLRGTEAIRKSVEAWDTSALQSIYALVKESLLDRMDPALEMLQHAAPGDLLNVNEWPIFEEIRSDPRYRPPSALKLIDAVNGAAKVHTDVPSLPAKRPESNPEASGGDATGARFSSK